MGWALEEEEDVGSMMITLRNGVARRTLLRLYSSGRNRTVSIEAGRLEFSRRNEKIARDLARYYPSLSEIPPCARYRPVTLEQFHKDYAVECKAGIGDATNLLSVNGKVKSVRFSGKKICFIDLSDAQSGVQLQLIVNYNVIDSGEPDSFLAALQFLKAGDFIQSYGFPSYSQSRAKTLSLNCTKLPLLLSAAQLPLPPKLNDSTKIKNNRVVDYQVNGVDMLILRHSIVKSLRDFLNNRGFIEVETPILSSKSNGAAAEPFQTVATSLPKSSNLLELRVAPELWLKRLIIGGLNQVYEIGKVFRNEGVDATHNPEFTTLEFYQSFTSMDELIEMSQLLFKHVLADLKRVHDNELLRELFRVLEENNWKFKRIEFLPTLSQELGVDFFNINLEIPGDIYNALPPDVLSAVAPNLSSQQLLNKLCSQFIEKKFCSSLLPTVIYHHPTVMSPLAKTDPLNPLFTKRFEIFINGQEYINAYEEENCPQWQLAKFELQQRFSEIQGDKEALNIDHNYVEAMKWGMPPIGGFGLGIDRLCMLLLDKKRIEEVITFGCIDDVNRQ